MAKELPSPALPAKNDPSGILAIPVFRNLWWNLNLSSLGDWLGLLATTERQNNLPVVARAYRTYSEPHPCPRDDGRPWILCKPCVGNWLHHVGNGSEGRSSWEDIS